MQMPNIACVKKLGKNLFEKEYANALGIFYAENLVFLAALNFQQATASIEKLVCLPIGFEEDFSLGEIVQKAVQTEGLPYRQCILCLAENKVVSLQKEFPSMRVAELEEAIKWELEDLLPFSGAEAAYGVQLIEENTSEMLVEIQAMEFAVLESFLSSFRQNNIEILAVVRQQEAVVIHAEKNCLQLDFSKWSKTFQINDATASPTSLLEYNFLPAIQAACYLKEQENMINILPRKQWQSRICWLRIYGILFFIGLIFMLGIYLQGVFQLHTLEKVREEQGTELALLKKSQEKRDSLIKKQEIIEKNNHILEKLSAKRISGQSVLVHLGLLPMGTVRLTEVELKDERGFLVCGDAPDYIELSKFMGHMEEVEFFKKVQLVDSGKKTPDKKDNVLHFVLQINFATKELKNAE